MVVDIRRILKFSLVNEVKFMSVIIYKGLGNRKDTAVNCLNNQDRDDLIEFYIYLLTVKFKWKNSREVVVSFDAYNVVEV